MATISGINPANLRAGTVILSRPAANVAMRRVTIVHDHGFSSTIDVTSQGVTDVDFACHAGEVIVVTAVDTSTTGKDSPESDPFTIQSPP